MGARPGTGNPAAFTVLNQVRTRAGLPALSPADLPGREALREQVYRERRAEPAFENHRWFDLLRPGQAEALLRAKGVSTRYLRLPVPQREKDLNPSLIQNDGY